MLVWHDFLHHVVGIRRDTLMVIGMLTRQSFLSVHCKGFHKTLFWSIVEHVVSTERTHRAYRWQLRRFWSIFSSSNQLPFKKCTLNVVNILTFYVKMKFSPRLNFFSSKGIFGIFNSEIKIPTLDGSPLRKLQSIRSKTSDVGLVKFVFVILPLERELLFYFLLSYFLLFCSGSFCSTLFYFSILFLAILFYSILFYSILFFSILFYSILFYSILFYSVQFYSILFYSILFYSILFYSVQLCFLFYFTLINCFLLLHYLYIYFFSIGLLFIIFDSLRVYSLLFYNTLFYSVLFFSILFSPFLSFCMIYFFLTIISFFPFLSILH